MLGEIHITYQLVKDWETIPFVSIEVVDGGECPVGSDPVFYKEWKGTERGSWVADFSGCGDDCTIPLGGGFV